MTCKGAVPGVRGLSGAGAERVKYSPDMNEYGLRRLLFGWMGLNVNRVFASSRATKFSFVTCGWLWAGVGGGAWWLGHTKTLTAKLISIYENVFLIYI